MEFEFEFEFEFDLDLDLDVKFGLSLGFGHTEIICYARSNCTESFTERFIEYRITLAFVLVFLCSWL